MKGIQNTLANGLGALALLLAPACVGTAPQNNGGGAGEADAGGEVDEPDAGGGEIPLEVSVSGLVLDYQEAVSESVGDPLIGAELATRGLDPVRSATAGPEGTYDLSDLPPGSVFYVDAAPGELLGYRPTVNAMVSVAEEPVEVDQYLVSEAHVGQHYATTQDTPIEGTAIVIIDMRRNNGNPFLDLALEDVSLTDALGEPIPDLAGPYFIGEGNVMDPEILTSTLAFGKTRVGFLNVPPGDHTFTINYLNQQDEPQTQATDVTTLADSATLVATGAMGDGGGGGGGGGGGALTFAKDIHPLLQRASQGGLSCASCHTAGGQMNALQFDLPVAEVYEAVTAVPLEGEPAIVNLEVPAESLLLTKPLYETPPNHPNATFANELDPYYITFMTWIEEGAVMGEVPPEQ